MKARDNNRGRRDGKGQYLLDRRTIGDSSEVNDACGWKRFHKIYSPIGKMRLNVLIEMINS